MVPYYLKGALPPNPPKALECGCSQNSGLPHDLAGGGRGGLTKHASILWREAYLGFYIGECHMFQKYW